MAVLGATGMVGQTFVRLLDGHPWFRLAEVAASSRSTGRPYGDVAHWLEGELPAAAAALEVQPCDPRAVRSAIVFSALDAATAVDVEPAFARAGRTVLSNASAHRLDADVPLVIPEVNPDHLDLLPHQRAGRGWPGALVTNSNCSTMVIALALAPLHTAFGVRQLFVTTLQAVSGAGYPGVASLDILGNTIPFIAGEEHKIEQEVPRLLGGISEGRVVPASMTVSAQVNRVPVVHGHTACMAVAFERRVTVEEAIRELAGWTGQVRGLGLPSAPEPPLLVLPDDDRPQPRRDAQRGAGMAITIGRVRADPALDLRLVALGHNTVRGAAGAAILNAELLVARGLAGP